MNYKQAQTKRQLLPYGKINYSTAVRQVRTNVLESCGGSVDGGTATMHTSVSERFDTQPEVGAGCLIETSSGTSSWKRAISRGIRARARSRAAHAARRFIGVVPTGAGVSL